MFGRSYRLPFRLLGIPVQLDLTFLLILPLLAWLIGSQVPLFTRLFGLPSGPLEQRAWMPYALGLIAAAGLFVAVVLHELGHAVTARLYGVKVKSITLWFLGGVAQFEEMPRQPGAEAVVSIVGPIVSIAIAGVCWVARHAMPSLDTTGNVATRFVLAYLVYTNVVLAIFNLIPALPLDGGRIFRSLLALKLPHEQATRIAGSISRFLAIALGLWGLATFNIFLLLVAVFIYLSGGAETHVGQVESLLRGVPVHEVMNRQVISVAPDLTVTDLKHRMLEEHHLGFPVVDSSGQLLGIITLRDVQGQNPAAEVRQFMRGESPTIDPHADAVDAFQLMSRNGSPRVVVMDGRRIVGLITKSDLMRLIQLRASGEDAGWLQQDAAPPVITGPSNPQAAGR